MRWYFIHAVPTSLPSSKCFLIPDYWMTWKLIYLMALFLHWISLMVFSFLRVSMTLREKDVWIIFYELPKTHICSSRSHEDDFSSKCCCGGATYDAFPPALHVRTSTHADYPVNELAFVFVLGPESKALYYLSFQGDLFISTHHSFKTSVFLHIAWASTSNSCPIDGPANTF